MERGGGERQEFGSVTEAPRATEGVAADAIKETHFAPIREQGSTEPAPAHDISPEPTAPTAADQTSPAEPLVAEDIRRDVPLDELDGFEDKILAGMEQ